MNFKSKKTKKIETLESEIRILRNNEDVFERKLSEAQKETEENRLKNLDFRLETNTILNNHKKAIEKNIRRINILQGMLFVVLFVTGFCIAYYYLTENEKTKNI